MQLENVYLARSEARKRLQTIAELNKLPASAISMGVAFTDVANNYALAVRVREKWGVVHIESLLRENLERMVEGDLDIRYTGPAFAIQPMRASSGPPRAKPISIGDSLSHEQSLGGTLGFFAKDRKSGDPGIVSANHVIAEVDIAKPGDSIVSPATGSTGSRQIAELVRSVPLHGGGLKLADAAFARLITNDFDPKTLPNGTLLGTGSVAESTAVNKVGEKSGLTFGHIRAFDYDKLQVLGYSSDLPFVDFENQIEIESSDAIDDFALDGDSGSLVYNHRFHAVGLLFSRCVTGGTFQNGLAYASPIAKILELLELDPL